MYKLLDRIPDGVDSMIDYLEEYIVTVGLRDMMAVANIIVQVSFPSKLCFLFNFKIISCLRHISILNNEFVWLMYLVITK